MFVNTNLLSEDNFEKGLRIAKESYESTRGYVDSESDQLMILVDPKGNEVIREISGKTLENDDPNDGDKSIIFFNKHDLFMELLMSEVSLGVCFGAENSYWKQYGKRLWAGPDYHKNKDKPQEDRKFFEFCRAAAETFIKQCYLDVEIHDQNINTSTNNKKLKRKIYTHITNAYDRSNIETVFWDVQNIVIRLELSKGGFTFSPLGN